MAKIEFSKGLKDKLQNAVDSAKTAVKDVKIPEVKEPEVKVPEVEVPVVPSSCTPSL